MGTTRTIIHCQGDKIATPTVFKDGFQFKGWFDQPVGGNQLQDDEVANGDMTYYAQWEEMPQNQTSYSISYALNNTAASLKNGTKTSYVASDLPYTVPSLANTTKTNFGNDPDVKKVCTFNGWWKNVDGTWVQQDQILQGETGNKEFGGRWTVKYENTYLPASVEISGKNDQFDQTRIFPSIPKGSYKLKFNDTIWATHFGNGNIGYHAVWFYIKLTKPGTTQEVKQIMIPISAVTSSYKSTNTQAQNSIHPVNFTDGTSTIGFSTNNSSLHMDFKLNEISMALTRTCDIYIYMEKGNSNCDGGKLAFNQSNRAGTATLTKV